MPSSEPLHTPMSERRMRWIAIIAIIVLLLFTMLVSGWRDWREVRRSQAWQPVDVASARAVAYDGALVRLVDIHALPPDPGLAKDRTFLRARLLVEPRRPGTKWLDCRISLIDAASHDWAAIETVPDLLQRALAKPGEVKGAGCDGLAVSEAKPGAQVFVDSYYLLPRPLPAGLRVTLSTRDGRPAYLRFSQGTVQ